MRIVEQAIVGKAGQQACEDTVVVTHDFVAVVDGSTSKSGMRFHQEMSNGRYCMTLVRQYIEQMAEDTDCRQFCEGITETVRACYLRQEADMDRLQRVPTERMAASAAIYSRARKEIWLVGDCQCLVDGALHENPKPYEEPIAEMRSAYLRLKLMQGRQAADFQEHDEGRDFILPVLKESCLRQNKDFAVIDGFDMALDKVHIIDVGHAHELVLASDGYPVLLPTLEESERALAQQLDEDPLCIFRFKATKGLMHGRLSFDDRCYVRMRNEL